MLWFCQTKLRIRIDCWQVSVNIESFANFTVDQQVNPSEEKPEQKQYLLIYGCPLHISRLAISSRCRGQHVTTKQDQKWWANCAMQSPLVAFFCNFFIFLLSTEHELKLIIAAVGWFPSLRGTFKLIIMMPYNPATWPTSAVGVDFSHFGNQQIEQ